MKNVKNTPGEQHQVWTGTLWPQATLGNLAETETEMSHATLSDEICRQTWQKIWVDVGGTYLTD